MLTLAQIPQHLQYADIVISSTASQLPILGKGLVQNALKERKHKPIFLVDLAVPRDVEAEVGELDDAYLYTVDDLQQIVEKNLANRQDAAEIADEMVAQQVQQFIRWQQSKTSIDKFYSNLNRKRRNKFTRVFIGSNDKIRNTFFVDNRRL